MFCSVDLNLEMFNYAELWIANMSGSGRLQLVMLYATHAKICVA